MTSLEVDSPQSCQHNTTQEGRGRLILREEKKQTGLPDVAKSFCFPHVFVHKTTSESAKSHRTVQFLAQRNRDYFHFFWIAQARNLNPHTLPTGAGGKKEIFLNASRESPHNKNIFLSIIFASLSFVCFFCRPVFVWEKEGWRRGGFLRHAREEEGARHHQKKTVANWPPASQTQQPNSISFLGLLLGHVAAMSFV